MQGLKRNSASVENFIKQNQSKVASQAIHSLQEIDATGLPDLVHRLTGTLLTYGMETEGALLGQIKAQIEGNVAAQTVQKTINDVIALLSERLDKT